MRIDAPLITGSLSYNGSSLQDLSTYATTSSVNNLIVQTGSYALTGSNYFSGSQVVSGSITAIGNITAQTLIVQTVTSSVLFTTGSNIIGSSLSNVQQITGSVGITGSLAVNGALSGTSTSFSSFITAQSTGGSGLRIYGSSGTNQWDVYLNSTNLRFSDNTGTGTVVLDRPLSGTSATFTSNVQATSIIRTISSGGGAIWTELQSDGVYSTNTDLYLYAPSSKYISFWAGASPAMRITSGGNVGIGTTTINSKLSIYKSDVTSGNSPASSGTTAVNGLAEFASNRGQGLYIGSQYSGEYGVWLQVSDKGNLGVNYPLLLQPNGGNVGIGTTSPTAKLEINGYGNANSIMTYVAAKFYGAGTGGVNIGTDGTVAMVATDSSGADLTFLTRVSGVFYERMRITSGGDVKLNTSGMFYSSNSVVAISPSGTTIFTPPLSSGMYLVTYVIGGNPSNVGYAIVGNRYGSTLYILASAAGSQTALSASGLNLVLSQSASGSNLNASISYIILNSGAAV